MAAINVTGPEFEKVALKEGIVFVDFWAAWCGPCRALAPTVDQIAEEYKGKLKVGKLDVDAHGALSARFSIRGIPTLLLFKNGELAETMVGLAPKEDIAKLIDKHL